MPEMVSQSARPVNQPPSFSIHAAVFAFFAGVAVQYAGAKHGGTNAPPQMMGLEEIVQLCNYANVRMRNSGGVDL